MAEWQTELTGRVLVLVAHPDDESVAYGALLPKMRQPMVVIATDGAPRDKYFWERFESRDAYRELRRGEARRAMDVAGVRQLVLLADADPCLEDQQLFLNLPVAYRLLEPLVQRLQPETIATLAYEGGHPDHDSCSLLAWRLGRDFSIPVWETPVYSRETVNSESRLRLQQFIQATGDESAVAISDQEYERKLVMCAEYKSQGDFLGTFNLRHEIVRPQMKYDYSSAPHSGQTNYEQWQWGMSSREVCRNFADFLEAGP
jgi:LmbE family N-acetylglucosaminyl deacetylase